MFPSSSALSSSSSDWSGCRSPPRRRRRAELRVDLARVAKVPVSPEDTAIGRAEVAVVEIGFSSLLRLRAALTAPLTSSLLRSSADGRIVADSADCGISNNADDDEDVRRSEVDGNIEDDEGAGTASGAIAFGLAFLDDDEDRGRCPLLSSFSSGSTGDMISPATLRLFTSLEPLLLLLLWSTTLSTSTPIREFESSSSSSLTCRGEVTPPPPPEDEGAITLEMEIEMA
jgi:hypothetical protein